MIMEINDGGSSYPLKKEAQQMYLDFWNIPSMILEEKERAYTQIKY